MMDCYQRRAVRGPSSGVTQDRLYGKQEGGGCRFVPNRECAEWISFLPVCFQLSSGNIQGSNPPRLTAADGGGEIVTHPHSRRLSWTLLPDSPA